jgi:16S rRNA (cytidine1402-2'-O)-methyltransferase
MKKGTLFLIPTPISSDQSMQDILLPMYLESISNLEHFIVETPKIARSFLRTLPLKKKIQEAHMSVLSEHTVDEELKELLSPIYSGNDIGVISDAGLPTIADPGYRIVSIAQEESLDIKALVGPSSIILSLMLSGLNGQSFAFNGYLPKEKGLKRKRIKSLERVAVNTQQTQIFMETPYKNQYMLEDILEICEDDTKLCIAMNIMSKDEYVKTKSISEWKSTNIVLEKVPCLFLINK